MAQTTKPYGWRKGGKTQVTMKVADAATSGVAIGDFVIMESGNAGYIVPCSAGDIAVGVAMTACSAPTSDGSETVEVCIDPTAIYEYPPDTGTVTQALVGTTMDTGGAQSINIDASADDKCICVGVDTDRNTLLIQLIPTFLGVV